MITGTLQGKYKVEVVAPDGSVTYPLGNKFHKNLVLNSGLDMMFNGLSPGNSYRDHSFLGLMSYARIGSDNTTPAAAQSLLGNQLNATGSFRDAVGANSITMNTSTGVVSFQRTFEFAPEVANVNYNEVGVSNDPGLSISLFSRALFGSTVTVLTGSNMRLTYILDVTIPLIVTPASVSVSAGAFNGEGDIRLVGTQAGLFGTINQNGTAGTPGASPLLRGRVPATSDLVESAAYLLQNSAFPTVGSALVPTYCGTNASDSISNAATGTYTLSSYQKDLTFTFPTGRPVADVSNVRSILFGGTTAGIQWLLDANQQKLTALALAPVFRVAWDRTP